MTDAEKAELRAALTVNMGHGMTAEGIEWLVRMEERVRALETVDD